MPIEGLLLGFDARVAPASIAPWPDERRRLHLLAPEVTTPLSVDTAVWPMAFDRAPTFLACGLSPSLEECTREGAVTIAVTWIPDAEGRDAERTAWEPRLCGEELDDGWASLGCDVVDLGGFSAAMNTGLGQRAPNLPRASLDRRSHLFLDRDAARTLRNDVDTLVVEHAPQAVVVIYVRRSTWTLPGCFPLTT